MPTEQPFVPPALNTRQKKQLLRCAQTVLTAQQQIIQNTGQSILYYTRKDKAQHERMSHYPKGDRIDHKTGAQYFYHCHRENLESTEHGHFHCFLRYKHIPARIKPTPLADWDKHIDNPMTHLIAIAMNTLGQPIRLFTVNRWVSSEIWYDAKHAPRLINRFKMTLYNNPYWRLLDQWVEGMLHLFAPQIAWLYTQRDAAIQAQRSQHAHPYDNQAIEELSSLPINLTQHIQWILNTP